MRKSVILFSCLLLFVTGAFAQLQDNEFRNSNNPLYWQNRKPNAAYWQQDVHYRIFAHIDEDENAIRGNEVVNYWNNSPDTLRYIFIHLYQNAFVKGSHLHELEKENKAKATLGKREQEGLGIELNNVKIDGQGVRTELDNSIMKIYLPAPLLPGARTELSLQFVTYYDNGSTRRRMQMWDAWGYKHYNGTQWYPKICVYDAKFGWDTYQHLNKEFYGDFGVFDVQLDFPSNYIVEATGKLVNREMVLPDSLRKKLDIKNFADKKWEEKPSIIIPYKKGDRKLWQFYANNVHDFAFTADPSYRIGTEYWNGIECVALVQEPHAARWQNAAEYVKKVIQTFSEDIGMYQYPKMVAADARDGMEYPMLTLDGGAEPGYRGLFVHEIGHNWFYGMVGNNETYRAALDEGFTQFLTSWGLRRIDGDYMVTGTPRSKYRRRFMEPTLVMDRNVLSPYTTDALNENELPINTASDDFSNALNHGGGYRLVYFKTASMLYNLQYTLGDSLFSAALKHYFDQWRFAHPYFDDFRNSIIDFTHQDLNWFFDEWMETTKTLDYGIKNIKKIPGKDSFAIHFNRSGEMQMPVDFTVTARNGKKYNFYIPNTWYQKETDATVLPKWYGWGSFYPSYTAKVHIPSGVKKVQIDTTYRLGDRDWVNNYKTRGLPIRLDAVKLKFDGGLAPQNDRRKYRLYVRPDVWWNAVDGIKLGAHVEGDYLNTLYKIDASVWWNTHVLQEDRFLSYKSETTYGRYAPINYTFNYLSPITRRMPKLQLQINSRILDGLSYHKAGLNWLVNDNNTISGWGLTFWRPTAHDLDYLIYPNEWSSNASNHNSSLNLAWTHRYNYMNGNGMYTISARTPLLTGNGPAAFDYSYVQLNDVNYNHLGKLDFRTRVFGRYGNGKNIPYESALFLAGANPEELMDDKYTRSVGYVPMQWEGTSRYDVNHFQQGGGLNLRAYSGYFSADQKGSTTYLAYKGLSGASASMEIDIDNYIPLHPKLTRNWLHTDLYFFGDAGVMQLSNYSLPNYWVTTPTTLWSDVRVDAGIGAAFTIKNWGVFEKAKPLTIRFDVPFFINRTPYANPQYSTFRYVIGINRAF